MNITKSVVFALWELKLGEKQTCRHSEKITSKRYYDEVTKVNGLKINPENNSEEEKSEGNAWKRPARQGTEPAWKRHGQRARCRESWHLRGR